MTGKYAACALLLLIVSCQLAPIRGEPRGECEAGDCSAQAAGLLQAGPFKKIGSHLTDMTESKDLGNENSEQGAPEAATKKTGVALLQDVKALVSDDGASATVSFKHEGQLHKFVLEAHSVYAENANKTATTNNGIEQLLETEQPRTFVSRADNGWASAAVLGDGTASGLFEVNGEVVEIRPAKDIPTSLLAVDAAVEGPLHTILHVAPLDLVQFPSKLFAGAEPGEPSAVALLEERARLGRNPSDEVPVIIPELPKTPMKPAPKGEHSDSEHHNRKALAKSWGGTKWWPGCYSGDQQMHMLQMGVAADQALWQLLGARTQPQLEQIVLEASFVYEKQMNIRLVIGNFHIFKAPTPAAEGWKNAVDSWGIGCPARPYNVKLDHMRGSAGWVLKQNALDHLFTACDGLGIMGLAYMGQICSHAKYGVTAGHRPEYWRFFAHEVGHNFNAQHTFEEPGGKSDGIMDYADGTLDGVYQFNTKYRKHEMCAHINGAKGRCHGGVFKLAPPTPPPTPAPPTPAPPPRRTSRRRRACFPADSMVDVFGRGPQALSSVGAGDLIAVADPGRAEIRYERLLGDFHSDREHRQLGSFIMISHTRGSVNISANHYLATGKGFKRATDVRVGDELTALMSEGGFVRPSTVLGLSSHVKQGLYAPFTFGGNIVVDGVLASAYTSDEFEAFVSPASHQKVLAALGGHDGVCRLTHVLAFPLRAAYALGLPLFVERIAAYFPGGATLHSFLSATPRTACASDLDGDLPLYVDLVGNAVGSALQSVL